MLSVWSPGWDLNPRTATYKAAAMPSLATEAFYIHISDADLSLFFKGYSFLFFGACAVEFLRGFLKSYNI